jgi:hypothetical protein
VTPPRARRLFILTGGSGPRPGPPVTVSGVPPRARGKGGTQRSGGSKSRTAHDGGGRRADSTRTTRRTVASQPVPSSSG